MALIKVDTYIVKHSIKMLGYAIKNGNDVFKDFYNERLNSLKLSFWERLRGKSLQQKYVETTVDYFQTIYMLHQENKMDKYALSALNYSAADTDRVLEYLQLDNVTAKEMLLDSWEYNLMHFFCEDEYKALLENIEIKH